MKSRSRGARGALVMAALAVAATAALASTAVGAVKDPIVIGWAYDGKGNMAPFDGPALAAAQIRVK